jgi:L-threonylcarbamoyladenylate synthase
MRIERVSSSTPESSVIAEAVEVLRGGGVVIYPTDTWYGLAVDPRRDDAAARAFIVKGRDAATAMPLIAGSFEQAELVASFTAVDRQLARAFWPGPLTLVLAPRPGISARVLGHGATIAIRVPAHAVARELAAQFAFCITATSANRSGEPPASAVADLSRAVMDNVDLVLDGGTTSGGLPSTIVETSAHGPRLVRAGAIAWERVLESLQ